MDERLGFEPIKRLGPIKATAKTGDGDFILHGQFMTKPPPDWIERFRIAADRPDHFHVTITQDGFTLVARPQDLRVVKSKIDARFTNANQLYLTEVVEPLRKEEQARQAREKREQKDLNEANQLIEQGEE